MIMFRKEHTVLRREKPMQLSDYRSYGFPDLSYHEEQPWISPWFINRRALGILYCGKYAEEEENVYKGFNFSDFRKKLSFPKEKSRVAFLGPLRIVGAFIPLKIPAPHEKLCGGIFGHIVEQPLAVKPHFKATLPPGCTTREGTSITWNIGLTILWIKIL